MVNGVAATILFLFTEQGLQEGIQGPRQSGKDGQAFLHLLATSEHGWIVTHKDMTFCGILQGEGDENLFSHFENLRCPLRK